MKKGADAFVRDKRGKRVLEGDKGADERIKMFLKQCKFETNSIGATGDMSHDLAKSTRGDSPVMKVVVLHADSSPKPR